MEMSPTRYTISSKPGSKIQALQLFTADMTHLDNAMEVLVRSCRRRKDKTETDLESSPMKWAFGTLLILLGTGQEKTYVENDQSSWKGWAEGGAETIGPAIDLLTAGFRLMSGSSVDELGYAK